MKEGLPYIIAGSILGSAMVMVYLSATNGKMKQIMTNMMKKKQQMADDLDDMM